MQQSFVSNQFSDSNGNPAGGTTYGPGITVGWQNGPLREQGADEPAEPNGCFVETVIAVAIDRLEFYQNSKFASEYNANAIVYLQAGLDQLHRRTSDRKTRFVEGTHQL